MGAFANLIDYKTGQLRWAFVVDPHLEVEQACSADTKLDFLILVLVIRIRNYMIPVSLLLVSNMSI